MVFARGYGVPPRSVPHSRWDRWRCIAAAPVQYFWILKNDTPVCTSLLFLENGVAGVYCVATLPEERKKGLVATRQRSRCESHSNLAIASAVLQSSAEGHPTYQRIGFADFGEVPLFVRMRSSRDARNA
jgi:hypothetical protein